MTQNTRNYMYAGIAVIIIVLAFILSKHQPVPVVQIDSTASSTGVSASSTDTASSDAPPVSSPASDSDSQASDTSSSQVLIKGSINLKEIGGSGLTVATARRVSTTDTVGTFAAMPVLPDHPTILTVSDSASKPRGYAVVFPETGSIVIGARTTAEATLIDPSADLVTGRKELAEIDNLKCFPAYVSFLQSKLPTESLDDIQKATDPKDMSNPHNACIAEIQAMVQSQ